MHGNRMTYIIAGVELFVVPAPHPNQPDDYFEAVEQLHDFIGLQLHRKHYDMSMKY